MLQPLNNLISSILDLGEEGYESLLKRPLFLMGRHGLKFRQMFLGIPRNQSAVIYAGVLWLVPIALVQQYASLYMVALGLSETEVGVYQNLMKLVGVLFFFLGGYFSDAWGRKKTLIFFDILSWGGYLLCMALARDKWWCVGAIFFLATNAGSGAAYQCLLAEGIASRKRTYVYTILQLVNMAPSLLFLPIMGGLWVSKRGLLAANHDMYWLFTVCVGLGIYLRWKFLEGSATFERAPESWAHVFRDGSRQYGAALGKFFRKPGSRLFLASKFLDEWMLFVWGIYSSLYFVNYLGMRSSNLGILTQGSAYVAFLSLFLIIPNISQRQMMRLLGMDQLFGLASLAVLLLLVHGSDSVLLVCLLSASLGAVGGALYGSVSAVVWMNIMDEKERAKVVAVFYAIIQVGICVTGTAGAYLYGHVSPMALLWLMVAMRVVGFVLLRRVAGILSNGELDREESTN